MTSIAAIRTDYRLRSLSEEDTASHPIDQFSIWWEEAINSKLEEVNAMTLATASPEGIPTARIVLLKGFDTNGFVFFTNYDSAKGKQLAANPHACLVFFWKELERQVRVSGKVGRLSEEDSFTYFTSRPTGSQIGAWSSPQSQVIPDRAWLEQREAAMQHQFEGKEIPKPPHWGGYVVQPYEIEFWQGRSSRLHDRITYKKQEGAGWKKSRLAP